MIKTLLPSIRLREAGTIVLLVCALFACPPAAAAVICAAPGALGAWLLNEHGETRRAFGIAANGNLIEIYLAPGGGFTIVGTSPQGVSCILFHGREWTPPPAATPPPPAGRPS